VLEEEKEIDESLSTSHDQGKGKKKGKGRKKERKIQYVGAVCIIKGRVVVILPN